MVDQEYINKNVTVIIRTVGERTTELCYELLKKQITVENIHIIYETPFTEALRKTFQVGLQENRKWTFVVDADVLVRPGVILELIEYAENVKENVFEMEGKVVDKFLFNLNPREAGNHLYRSILMEKAIDYIPHPFEAIRPETYVKDKMRENGFEWQVISKIIGIHDFEQYYKDIYRKCFIQAKKHTEYGKNLLPIWEKKAEFDNDFKIAINGFKAGLKWNREVAIDKNSTFMDQFEKLIESLELKEKGYMKYSDEVLKYLDNIDRICFFYNENFISGKYLNFMNYFIQNIQPQNNETLIYIASDDDIFIKEARKLKTNIIYFDTSKAILKNLTIYDSIIFYINSSFIKDDFDFHSIVSLINNYKIRFFITFYNNKETFKRILQILNDNVFDIYIFDYNEKVFFKYKNNIYNVDDSSEILLYAVKKDISFSFCYFIHSSMLTGAERSALDIVKKLIIKYGAVPTVILPKKGSLQTMFAEIGVPTIVIDYKWWTTNPYYSPYDITQSILNIIASKHIFERINPDVIMTQTLVIPWGAIMAFLLKKPHIWNVREYGKLDHGINFYYTFDDILDFIKRSSAFITTCGKSVKEVLFPKESQLKCDVAYAHVDINTEKYNNYNNFVTKDSKIMKLLLPGTIIPSKGQIEAVKAIDIIVNERNFKNLHLTIIGGFGNAKYLEEIKDLIKQKRLSNFITIKEFTPEIYDAIVNADIVLSCSKMEAFSRVIVESFILGKPVIASNKGGNIEIVKDGINGYLYEQGSSSDLADKIQCFIESPDKLVQMGVRGKKTVEEVLKKNYAEDIIYKTAMNIKKNEVKYDSDFFLHWILKFINPEMHLKQILFIDSGSGFNGNEIIESYIKVSDGNFKSEFILKGFNGVKSIRFDPVEGQPCKCKIEKVETDGVYNGIAWTNAGNKENGFDVFYTTDPIYIFNGDFSSATYINVSGKIEFLNPELIQNELESTKSELESMKSELLKISTSNTYRVAVKLEKIARKTELIYPLKWMLRLYGKVFGN